MERILRRAGVWLVLIVMVMMAFCGCKKDKYARVNDEDFEKTGYYFDDGDKFQPSTLYYYVIKNNSKETVSIIGTAKAYFPDGTLLEEHNDDIPVLGPGETSVMKFTINKPKKHIDHIDCELQYYKTDLIPVIGDIRTECMRSEDEFTAFVTNESDVDVTSLNGVVLFFDSENNVIATDEEEFREHKSVVQNIMKPGTSRAVMFIPQEFYKGSNENAGRRGYDHAELFLRYLDIRPDGVEVQRRSNSFIDDTEGFLEVKGIHCKNTAGYQIHCLAVKNISGTLVGVHGAMKVYSADGRPLTALTSTVDALAPGEETILPFEFTVFDPIELNTGYREGYTATDEIKNADFLSYTLKVDPLPSKIPTVFSVEYIDPEHTDKVCKEAVVSYSGTGKVRRPRIYGIFYDSKGDIVFAGYAQEDTFYEDYPEYSFVNSDYLQNGDCALYGFDYYSRWLYDKETGEYLPLPKFDRADLYILED